MIKTLLENVKAFYYFFFLHIESNTEVSFDKFEVIGFHSLCDCNVIN